MRIFAVQLFLYSLYITGLCTVCTEEESVHAVEQVNFRTYVRFFHDSIDHRPYFHILNFFTAGGLFFELLAL